jgi:hypothetical protein
LLADPAALRARIRRVARSGLQPAVHAIGDRACRAVLRALAAAPELARTAGDHLAAQAALRQGRHEVAELTRAMHAGRDEARQLGEQLAGLPSERDLLRRVGEQARGLSHEAIEGVHRGLSQVQRLAFGHALHLVKEAALGRDDRGMER